jgi:hypothetical protein
MLVFSMTLLCYLYGNDLGNTKNACPTKYVPNSVTLLPLKPLTIPLNARAFSICRT